MYTIDILLTNCGFHITYVTRGRASITEFFPLRARCGIYVLHLSDNTYYVGLSTDITERYRQHTHHFPDIVAISFKAIRSAIKVLREEERQTIHYLNAHQVPLLNCIHNTLNVASSLFDVVMTPREQNYWLAHGSNQNSAPAANAAIAPSIFMRDQRTMTLFLQLPNHGALAEALKQYIIHTIPVYQRTAGSYWAMSCLPTTLGGWRAATISMSYMETFVLHRDGTSFINVASTVFTQSYPTDQHFMARYPGTRITSANYEAAGFNQLCIDADSYTATWAMLADPAIHASARLMNISLMRQRPTLYARHHSSMLTSFVLQAATP